MINRPLLTDECISLVKAMFCSPNETEAVKHLRGHDAQTFVDVIDKVHFHLPSLQNRLSGLTSNFLIFPIVIGDEGASTIASDEVSRCFAQDMWFPGFDSKICTNSTSLRPLNGSIVSGWVRRRLGVSTSRFLRCS